MTPLPSSAQHAFLLGARDTIPMLLGCVPFAIVYGSFAVMVGLSVFQTAGMSIFVFAGSAQFIAISLLGSGAGGLVVVVTILVVNLRHVLYSASMQPFVRHLSRRWRAGLAFFLTDETFAVVHGMYQRHGAIPRQGHWYYLGSALAMYGNWILCSLVGAELGQSAPQLAGWGLDFAMLATFIGIVVPLLRSRPQLAAALVAGAVAVLAHEWPYKLGLLTAALAGIVTGVVLERRRRPSSGQRQEP